MAEKRKPFLFRFIRPWGLLSVLVFLVLSVAAVFFGTDLFITSRFEKIASRVHGAQVNLESFSFNPVQGRVELKGIQVTNPASPLRNIFEVDKIEISYLTAPFLRKKLIVSDLQISGISYDTPRTTSGELEETETFYGATSLFDRAVTGYDGPVREMLKSNPLKYLASLSAGLDITSKIERMRGQLESLKNLETQQRTLDSLTLRWQQQRKIIPSDGWLQQTEIKVRELKKKHASKAEIKEVKDSILQTEKGLTELFQFLKDNFDGTQRGLASLGQGFEKDTRLVREALKLPDLSVNDISPALFGTTILRHLEHLGYWVDLSRRKMPPGDPSERMLLVLKPVARGTDVHYANVSGYPSFLIPNGNIKSTGPGGKVQGGIWGLTTEPSFYGRTFSAALKLDFPEKGIKNIEAEMLIDHTTPRLKEKLTLKVGEIPISPLPLHESTQLSLFLDSGTATFQFEASFDDNRVEAEWSAEIDNAHYRIHSPYAGHERALGDVLLPITQVSLKGKVFGPVNDLAMECTSNLGQTLLAGLREHFRHRLAAIDDTIKSELINQVDLSRRTLNVRLSQLHDESIPKIEASLQKVKRLENLL